MYIKRYAHNRILISFLLLWSGQSLAGIEDLDRADSSTSGFQSERVKKKLWESDIYGLQAYIENYNGLDVGLIDGVIVTFKNDFTEVVKVYSLTRWPHEPTDPKFMARIEEVFPQGERSDIYTLHTGQQIGCLNDAPLRYGDIESDGRSEIVLLLGDDLVVFSPESERIIFSFSYQAVDWMSAENSQVHEEIYPSLEPEADLPQYQSAWNPDYRGALLGYRGYGKLYFDDFDQNEQPDILVNKKLYLSKKRGDALNGFTPVSDRFYHFQMSSTGVYLPQKTPESQIQAWLSENNQSWQTGYPSKSECVGQEGLLIPEMHDPLLNDPEVLR